MNSLSSRELVLNNSQGSLAIIARFVPMELDLVNTVTRASTNLAFQHLVETYKRSKRIERFLPNAQDNNLSARDTVKHTIQAIVLHTQIKGSDAVQGLDREYLESRLKLFEICRMINTSRILNRLQEAGFAITRTDRQHTFMIDRSGRVCTISNNPRQSCRTARRIYEQAAGTGESRQKRQRALSVD